MCTIGTGCVIYFVFNLKVCNREGDKIKHPGKLLCAKCAARWNSVGGGRCSWEKFPLCAGVAVENNVSLGAASIYYLI